MKTLRILSIGVLGASLGLLSSARAASEDTNLLSNGSFESGADLDSPEGTPDHWTRGGSNASLCIVAFPVPEGGSHALAVDDDDSEAFAEWYTELDLRGIATEGDSLAMAWKEMYAVGGGEMRVSTVFFDDENSVAGQNHFVVSSFSEGWNDSPQDSTYTEREEELIVPAAAVRMTVSLVSGGSLGTTGIMVIDDLCISRPKQPVLLSGNFWPNATFEDGTNLDQADGTVTAWNRGGSDPTIDTVTNEASVSPGHALTVMDDNAAGYGEWYADLPLEGNASPGGTLQVQWFEFYNVSDGGAMRVTALFLDAGQNVVGERHFEVTGDSAGWGVSIGASEFTRRNESLDVPAGAVMLRISLVSGGPEGTTGVMVIDDLSIASPVAPQVLSGNFWNNAGFEEGAGLDAPDGTVSGWNRGGSLTTICQVTGENAESPQYSLAVVDESTDSYGEWYADQGLGGVAGKGDVLNIQWFELFDISSGGAMRVSVLFLSEAGSVVGENHFETSGQSKGWSGDVASGAFSRMNVQITVPEGATTLRVSLVSGGSLETTGVMLIDDLSVALLSEGDLTPGNIWPNPTFELGARLDEPMSGRPQGWNRGGSNAQLDQVTTENFVSPSHALAVIDDDENGYGEWYYPFDLAGSAEPGDELTVRWFEMYDINGGEMRLTLLFFDGGTIVEERHFTVNGPSEGWDDDIASSEFTEREEFLVVPEGATRLQIGLVSGGGLNVTGTYVIDDLSIGNPQPIDVQIETVIYDAEEEIFQLDWPSSPGRSYTLLFSPDLIDFSEEIAAGIPSGGDRTSFPAEHPGGNFGFFRVLEDLE